MDDIKQAQEILNKWYDIVYENNSDARSVFDTKTYHQEFIKKIKVQKINNKNLIIKICEMGNRFLTNNDIKMIEFCDKSLLNDIDVILAIVSSNAYNLEDIPAHFKRNKIVVKRALEHDDVLIHAHPSMRKDKELILLSIEKSYQLDLLSYVGEELKNDPEILLKVWNKISEENNFKFEKENFFNRLGSNVKEKLKDLIELSEKELIDNLSLNKEVKKMLEIMILKNKLNEKVEKKDTTKFKL